MSRPRATYRLQFRNGMDFDKAAGIVPYLKELGISHLYASPIFTAVSGSTHGYDVTDHTEIDPALGGRDGFERLSAALKQNGLGLILDIVPNHMAASLENAWWRSVIEWGAESPFRDHFDIDWSERVTLPILGRPYDEVVGAGELTVRPDNRHGVLALAYFDTLLPLHPDTYAGILSQIDDPLGNEIAALASAATPDTAAAMQAGIRPLLSGPVSCARLETVLESVSRQPGFIDQVHGAQPWRLTFWKDARKHLCYRRFFEVTGLVGVRVEEDRVFDDVHRLILDLVRSGQADGLRVDHVDGLSDPKTYLDRLRQAIGPETYLVVEKILCGEETLPSDWPISGTTGYEFIAGTADLFVDEDGPLALERGYCETVGHPVDLEAERRDAKRLMITRNFETELTTLSRLATRFSESGAYSERALREAIAALVIAFPVYRTYGNADCMPDRDRQLLHSVADDALRRDDGDQDVLYFVLRLLLGDVQSDTTIFRSRFQQLTGPVMAKAVEDTLFYRYNRFIALNEVGGDPMLRSGSRGRFHAKMEERTRLQPQGLLATATHDTKRGEDARARLYAISEAPALWSAAIARWRAMHRASVVVLPDGPAPEPETEWMLYQALAGMWPSDCDRPDATALADMEKRFGGFVEKALREAKRRTSWTEIDERYEATVKTYASRLFGNDDFVENFSKTLKPFAQAGALNSLAQTLIKLTAPGIPDIYQGTEGLDLSLVDPDNRRPVDFPALSAQLRRETDQPFAADNILSGRAKQAMIASVLCFRATREALFAEGSYEPLRVSGTMADHVVAFSRRLGEHAAITVVPRLMFHACGEDFGEGAIIELPRALALKNVLTGETYGTAAKFSVSKVLRESPVALLASDP
ncbi:malto-oligosyltrehalose synthase [soil metagenome]